MARHHLSHEARQRLQKKLQLAAAAIRSWPTLSSAISALSWRCARSSSEQEPPGPGCRCHHRLLGQPALRLSPRRLVRPLGHPEPGLVAGSSRSIRFPFGLLTMIVSLEAIFLATFVLVSQNRMAPRRRSAGRPGPADQPAFRIRDHPHPHPGGCDGGSNGDQGSARSGD